MLFDILIVGSGIAGLRAAIEASKYNLKVGIMTKTNPLKSNSSMASGGINAALGNMDEDNVQNHINDTIKGGAGLSNKKAVESICHEALSEIDELGKLGVLFDTKDDGKVIQRSFGGAGKKRTCYVQDKTGAAIVQALIKHTRKENIHWIKDTQLINLLHNDGRIGGVSALNRANSTVEVYVAKSVILASGGYAGIYKGYTTNPIDNCGESICASLRAGLRLSNMEFVQFHPTGLSKSGALVSEAARGEGGFLVNQKGERFINELETRDKVALAVYEQLQNGNRVFLDIRHLGEELIDTKLPTLKKACVMSEGVDPVNELIPIKPVAHYTMGGIECDVFGKTSMKGLFVCGEAAQNGMHGANRLGGNSLLEASVSGKLAAQSAVAFAKEADFERIDYEQVSKDCNLVEHILEGENRYNINSIRTNLGNTMFKNVGLVRDEAGLNSAKSYINYLRRLFMTLHCVGKNREYNMELAAILEIRSALHLAEATIHAALAREESRGAHNRSDFPNRDDKRFQKSSYIEELKTGYFRVGFEGGGIFSKVEKIFKKFATN